MKNPALAGLVFGLTLHGEAFAQTLPNNQPTKPEPRCEDFKSIGSATMDTTGVITMNVFTLPPGPIGHGRLVYGPDHPKYQDVLKHLGPISPGESVYVRPWC